MTSNLVDAKIANKIVVLRDVQVMIDRDIAELYGVEIKVLNQAVKRNAERFPKQFMFQLSLDEYRSVKESLWSQFVTIENIGDLRGRHSKYLPHAFTEQGVAMLSAVLRSEKAIKVSIEIMNAFVQMRHYFRNNLALANRLTAVENKVESKFKTIDIDKFNEQYPTLDVARTKKMHDRFMIIDNKELYHIGASLKDLGKACFAFEKMDEPKKWISVILTDLR